MRAAKLPLYHFCLFIHSDGLNKNELYISEVNHSLLPLFHYICRRCTYFIIQTYLLTVLCQLLLPL